LTLAAAPLTPRARTSRLGAWAIVGSLLLHAGAVATLAVWGKQPRKHEGTMVTVAKPKPKPKPAPTPEDEETPKPPPPPPRVVPQVKAVELPAPVAAPAPAAPAASSGHVASGLNLSNAGPSSGGIAVGGLSNTPQPRGPAPQAGDDDKAGKKPPPQARDERCDQPDTKPKPAGRVQVDYPDKARTEGIEGRIQVRIQVGDDGSVIGVEVVEGIEASLDAVVLSVLRTWKFLPATHCGKPVPGVLAWAQRFELGD
jgi:protein TonB